MIIIFPSLQPRPVNRWCPQGLWLEASSAIISTLLPREWWADAAGAIRKGPAAMSHALGRAPRSLKPQLDPSGMEKTLHRLEKIQREGKRPRSERMIQRIQQEAISRNLPEVGSWSQQLSPPHEPCTRITLPRAASWESATSEQLEPSGMETLHRLEKIQREGKQPRSERMIQRIQHEAISRSLPEVGSWSHQLSPAH